MTETKTPRTPAQILETGAAWVTEGELESLVTALAAAQEKLAREKELRGMQLVGISTVSMQNTEESVTYRIERSNPYWTEAYGDVCAAIDREITERAARLQADHERAGMLEKLRAETAARDAAEHILSKFAVQCFRCGGGGCLECDMTGLRPKYWDEWKKNEHRAEALQRRVEELEKHAEAMVISIREGRHDYLPMEAYEQWKAALAKQEKPHG